MLRRKPSDTALLDEIDLTLLRAVEAGMTWRAILQNCGCEADEAQLRVLRLIHTGHLEGEPGDAARPTVPVRSAPIRPAASPAASVATAKTVPPSARAAHEALLRELSSRRASTSYPPVRASEPATPTSSALLPGFYSVRPGSEPAESSGRARPSASAREAGPAVISSAPPGRYSMSADDQARASSSAPPGRNDDGFDSPLAALIHEFAHGQERDRWCAERLRDALHEELSGNVQQAISILQSLTTQLTDPRIRSEHDRLQARSLKATSGVYRSHALRAERADKHKEAAESWRKVLEACPEDAEAALHAAQCNMALGDLKQAGLHARRAVELAPESVAAHRLLLRFFRKTGMEHNANRERELLRKLAKG